MSSRRSLSRQSGAVARAGSRITDQDQINDLVAKLQQLRSELRSRRTDKVRAARVLQETCNYIRCLQREVDDLSQRLSEILDNDDGDDASAALVRSLATSAVTDIDLAS